MFFTEDFQKHQPCRMLDAIPFPGKILALAVLAWPGKVWQRHLGFLYTLQNNLLDTKTKANCRSCINKLDSKFRLEIVQIHFLDSLSARLQTVTPTMRELET